MGGREEGGGGGGGKGVDGREGGKEGGRVGGLRAVSCLHCIKLSWKRTSY